MIIEEYVYSALLASNEISDICDERIYPHSMDEEETLPAIVWHVSDRKQDSSNSAFLTNITFASMSRSFLLSAQIEKHLEDLFLENGSVEGFCIYGINLLNVHSEEIYLEGDATPIFVFFGEFSFMHE